MYAGAQRIAIRTANVWATLINRSVSASILTSERFVSSSGALTTAQGMVSATLPVVNADAPKASLEPTVALSAALVIV